MNIKKIEFLKRRNSLFNLLENNSISILFSSSITNINFSNDNIFRQDSNFFYLTGFEEPDSIVILYKNNNNSFIVFNKIRNIEEEKWTGETLGQKKAKKLLLADFAYPISYFSEFISNHIKKISNIYVSNDIIERTKNNKLMSYIYTISDMCKYNNLKIKNIDPLIYKLRSIKSEYELKCIKKSCNLISNAVISSIKSCKPNLYEYHLESEINYYLNKNAIRKRSFQTIVGGGKNSCILHYEENNKKLKNNSLVLIDCGCEYNYYASDVTRTIPVNGIFTNSQKILYTIVLNAQKMAISKVKPGNSFLDCSVEAIKVISKGLKKLGIIKETSITKIINDELYKEFFMTNIGHFIGLDVHEPYSNNIKFSEGMVLTIEPGIYIKKSKKINPIWWNIGIRIEDMLVVTKNNHKIISCKIPKNIDEIENLMHDGLN